MYAFSAILCLASGVLNATGHAEAEIRIEVEETLDSLDQVFCSDGTLQGQEYRAVDHPSGSVAWDKLVVWEDAGSVALQQASNPEYCSLHYIAPDEGEESFARKNLFWTPGDLNMVCNRSVFSAMLVDTGAIAQWDRLGSVTLDADDHMIDENDNILNLISHFPSDKLQSMYSGVDDYVLMTGRGFSRYLRVYKEVTEVGGTLRVVADGSYGTLEGEWTLEIEIQSGWLVRRAEFTHDDRPRVLIETEGTLWCEAASIAETSTYWWGRRDPEQGPDKTVVWASHSSDPDSVTLESVRRELATPSRPSTVHDFRAVGLDAVPEVTRID